MVLWAGIIMFFIRNSHPIFSKWLSSSSKSKLMAKKGNPGKKILHYDVFSCHWSISVLSRTAHTIASSSKPKVSLKKIILLHSWFSLLNNLITRYTSSVNFVANWKTVWKVIQLFLSVPSILLDPHTRVTIRQHMQLHLHCLTVIAGVLIVFPDSSHCNMLFLCECWYLLKKSAFSY